MVGPEGTTATRTQSSTREARKPTSSIWCPLKPKSTRALCLCMAVWLCGCRGTVFAGVGVHCMAVSAALTPLVSNVTMHRYAMTAPQQKRWLRALVDVIEDVPLHPPSHARLPYEARVVTPPPTPGSGRRRRSSGNIPIIAPAASPHRRSTSHQVLHRPQGSEGSEDGWSTDGAGRVQEPLRGGGYEGHY